jgi:hypothetical protein
MLKPSKDASIEERIDLFWHNLFVESLIEKLDDRLDSLGSRLETSGFISFCMALILYSHRYPDYRPN